MVHVGPFSLSLLSVLFLGAHIVYLAKFRCLFNACLYRSVNLSPCRFAKFKKILGLPAILPAIRQQPVSFRSGVAPSPLYSDKL